MTANHRLTRVLMCRLVLLLIVGLPLPARAQAPGRFTTMTITSTASDALKVGTASLADTDLNKIDGITNGTVAASKAIVVDSNKDVSGLRHLAMTGALTTTLPGPHAIGGGINVDVQLNILGTLSGAVNQAIGVGLSTTLPVPATANAFGLRMQPIFVEAGSGAHPLLTTVGIDAATVTGGAATVTNTASLYIAGAMSATVTGANYALWVDAGVARFDGDIQTQALIALGGGAAPTLGTIGGSGPATAAQNSWARFVDASGVAFWVPAWK